MGFFSKLFGFGNRPRDRTEVVDICELLNPDGLELQFREAASWGCVNLIANNLGKCEVKEFRNGAPEKVRWVTA